MPERRKSIDGYPALPTWSDDLIDLRQINQVIQICETGSITDAASLLGMNQPALSKSIAKLEVQLGVKLFKRAGVGIQPTELARLIVDKGKALLNSASLLDAEIKSQAAGESGLLRIGFTPASRVYPLRAIPAEISAKFPNLRLNIQMQSGRRLLDGLMENSLDLAIVYHLSALPYEDLMKVKLIESRVICVVRPGHPILGLERDQISKRLLDFRVASTGLNPKWLNRLSQQHRANATAIHCEDFITVIDCATASEVIGLGPAFAFKSQLDDNKLIEVPNDFTEKFAAWLVGRPEVWQAPVTREIINIAKAAAATLD